VKILLQWSYDKFGTNRRESLKNVYENCLKYDDTIEGKESFKKSLEAYFKFTEATYILQHIAENNNKDIVKWFEVFYDENNNFIKKDSLIDLKGNLQRFLESFQSNTGLNLINGLTNLLLSESFNKIEEQRFTKSFDTISNYEDSTFDFIIDHILELSKRIDQKGKIVLLKFLYKFSKTEEEKLRFAKELGDTETILIHYNNRLKSINKNIEYGFRKIG
jgi:ATP-dependent DNA helicase RecQ